MEEDKIPEKNNPENNSSKRTNPNIEEEMAERQKGKSMKAKMRDNLKKTAKTIKDKMAERHVKEISYESEEESRRAFIEICAFLIFLTITTYIAISLQTIYSFYFNRTVDRLFSKRVSSEMEVNVKFEEITTIEEFWSFLRTTFSQNLVDNWHAANHMNDYTAVKEELGSKELSKMLFLGQNLVLEAPRIRQIRVKSFPCFKHKVFKDIYELCYGPYRREDEVKEPIFKGTRFFDIERTSVMPFWGNLARYYGAGYVAFLTYNMTDNDKIIEKLVRDVWIDRSSRLIMIEMVVYNNNMDLFNNMKFVAELMPIGGIVSYSHMEVAPLFSVWSIQSPGILAANLLFYAFILFNTGNEISEIYQYGLKRYSQSVWNYIDWGILFMAYFSLVLSILHGYFIDEYLEDVFAQNYEQISSIDKACHWFAIYVCSIACLAFLVWIRIFRFIGFNKTMLAFYLALKQCARDIFGFAIILFIVFMGFALLGIALFGTSNLDFSTFQYAYFFMMRLMLKDFEYSNFERSDPFWGELYFMCFIVVVVFLCFNMFLAIISQTYINVKKDNIESKSSIKVIILKIYQRLVQCLSTLNKKLSSGQGRSTTPPLSANDEIYDDAERKPSDERVTPKKIQFQNDDDSLAQPILSAQSAPRQMNEDEALREYFGVRHPSVTSVPSSSLIKRSISQYSVATYETPESSIGEEELASETDASASDYQSEEVQQEEEEEDDHLAGIRERVRKLRNMMDGLGKDMRSILNKLLELERLKRAS